MQGWVATALYWFGQIYAILLITQFWTLANIIFDPRQAKRLFGFIGAGSSLGGLVGGSLPAFFAADSLAAGICCSSAPSCLPAASLVVIAIVSRARGVDLRGLETVGEEKGVGGQEALRMLRESKHLQIIAVVIGLTSIGAGLVDQQLNMATQAFKGRDQTDAMTAVLGQVQVYVSGIGFLIQMFLTTRIQRLLGVGFALMLLPLGFGVMAVIILLNAALWAPMLARVMDKSLRYTVDKTSREILFLPLPDAIKNKAKPFVDVTADRFARALQGLVMLILIAPWGLGLDWQQVSYASLIIMAGWIGMVVVAKRAYANAFRATLAASRGSRGRRPAARGGSRRDRDARRGAGPPGRPEGAQRHRSARVAGEAESRHASPSPSPVIAGSREGAHGVGIHAAGGRAPPCRYRRTPARRPGRRGARRCDRGAHAHQGAGCRRPGPAVALLP